MFEAITKSGDNLVARNTLPPVGTILFIAGNTVPENCVPAVGEELNRTTYADLFSVTGTLYGEGDGSTTFNAPDMRNRFPEGSQAAGGYNTAGLPNITGSIIMHGSQTKTVVYNATGAFVPANINIKAINGTSPVAQQSIGIIGLNASRSSSVYGASPTVQPASVKLLPVIVYRSKRTVINSGGGHSLRLSSLIGIREAA